jgi:hypothetical protein
LISIAIYFSTVLWCFTKVLNLPVLIISTFRKWKINILAKSIIILLTDWLWLFKSLCGAICRVTRWPRHRTHVDFVPPPQTWSGHAQRNMKTNSEPIILIWGQVKKHYTFS